MRRSRRSEEPFRESEERFRLLVEAATDYAIFMLDLDGRVASWDEGARRLFGYTDEEILGEPGSALFTPEDVRSGVPERQLEKAAEEGRAEDERWYLRKDGSRVWASGFVRPIRDESGDLRGFAKVARDITHRKETEDKLRESEERFRATFEQAAVGVAHVSTDGRLLRVNHKLCEIFGYAWEEMLRLGMEDLAAPEDQEADLQQARRVLAGEIESYSLEKRYLRKDGAVIWANLAVSLVRDPSGGPQYFIGAVEDITERKRIEEAQRFLAEAGDVLSSSLDYRETLSSVARLAVSSLADWCTVDVLTEEGSLERLAVEHPDPEKVELAYKLQERYPPEPDAPRGVRLVLRTGEPDMMPEIPQRLIEEAARDEEHREILRKLGLRSYIVAPLVARGRTLGAISLVSAESGRRYGEADLRLARELARRAAIAVDNAWLYEQAQREIAERAWAQEELRGSREQLEVILKGVADGIIAQDASGGIFYANEAAARMSGYPSVRPFVEAPADERLGKFELLDAEGSPFPLERLPGRRALQGEEGAEEVLRFRAVETGEERWASVSATPVFDADGRVHMSVSIMRDITERRRAEQERARLAAIVESSDDAIIGKTLEGTITSWNGSAQRIYGYSAEEAVGRPITMLVPPELPDEIPGILEKIRRGEKVEHFETVRVARDGRRLDISLSVSPIRNSAGDVVGASTIARDITERKRTETALREVRETERQRIARDLHDGVLQDLSYAAIALEVTKLNAQGTALESELQEEVDTLRSASQDLRAAVYDLRLADELDQPLPRLLESLVDRNRAMARDQEIRVEVEEGFPATPLGDAAAELSRIVQEALTNARRHSAARNVLVTLKVEGEELIVEVADDGRGFGPGASVGVGSRSMRERAASLGGELRVLSEPGNGTTVQLRTPMPGSSSRK
ncbi:PAS domain S-box protein [Rubrobacter marinus]|uniref:PAS domain S-box protein n=1 Tax=Rubrobacter marinus TaxID=2653852 RepID=UPI00140E40E6|nr:PAS domain S-box protein [Rubrobacter marinus]